MAGLRDSTRSYHRAIIRGFVIVDFAQKLLTGVGCPGWERSLPLGIHPDAILRGQHERELPFGEVSVDREDRPENRTPPAQMKDWIRDIGDVIADPRGWELVAGYGIRQWDKLRGRWVHAE